MGERGELPYVKNGGAKVSLLSPDKAGGLQGDRISTGRCTRSRCSHTNGCMLMQKHTLKNKGRERTQGGVTVHPGVLKMRYGPPPVYVSVNEDDSGGVEI